MRGLLVSQAAAVAGADTLPLRHEADGWDCSVWRLGNDLAVRLPRRAVAAPLVLHEHRLLASIAARVTPSGVGVPAPQFAGEPGPGFPWPWSIVPWFAGEAGAFVPRAARAGWGTRLAGMLRALHVPASSDFPRNPVRGGPLAGRAAAVGSRLEGLRGRVPAAELEGAAQLWHLASSGPAWAGPPVCIHGDLHPGNLVARGATLVAVIDFGDVCAGDPAYDLAIAWLAFDAAGRARFQAATGEDYDQATWIRARGWAAAVAALMLAHGDGNPVYAELGRDALAEVVA